MRSTSSSAGMSCTPTQTQSLAANRSPHTSASPPSLHSRCACVCVCVCVCVCSIAHNPRVASPLQVFKAEGVDVAVVEVGIGGRFDSTNVIPRPYACGVTSLGLEHTQILGHDLKSIAFHKGGIFKRGVPALMAPQDAVPQHELLACARDAQVHHVCVCVCVCVCKWNTHALTHTHSRTPFLRRRGWRRIGRQRARPLSWGWQGSTRGRTPPLRCSCAAHGSTSAQAG